jgi:hypothetical protein
MRGQKLSYLRCYGIRYWVTHSEGELGRLSMCHSELQGVFVSGSTIIVVTSFKSPVNPITIPNPVYSR